MGRIGATGAEIWRRITEAIPVDLLVPGVRIGAPARIRLESLTPDRAWLAGHLDGVKARQGISLVVPASVLLSQEFTLPRAARARARAIIALRLRQTLPRQAAGLRWVIVTEAADRAGARYTVYVAKEDHLEHLRRLAAEGGVDLRSVVVDRQGAPALFTEGMGSKAQRGWAMAAAMVVILASLWPRVGLEIAAWRLAGVNDAIEAENQALRQQAVELRAGVSVAEEQGARLKQDLAALNGGRDRLGVLVGMTKGLPDSIWISELTISGANVNLAGFASADAKTLVEMFQSLPMAQTVRLDGPIIPDPTGNQVRFQAAITLGNQPAASQ